MPSTAAGGRRGAEAARGHAVGSSRCGEGLWRSVSGSSCWNHEPSTANSQYALLVAGPPGKSLLPGRRCRLSGHGPAGRRSGRAGGEAGSCPSFLPFFEIKIPSSGRSARSGPGWLCCQPPRLRGARGLWAPGPRPAALPRGGGRGRRLGTRGRPGASPASGSREAARRQRRGRGCGRCWRGRAESVGRELHRWRTEAARSRSARARPPRPAALPASRLTVSGPALRRHALRPRAPRGPQPAVGASPCPAPPRLWPAAAQLSWDPGPCSSDAPHACPGGRTNSEDTRDPDSRQFCTFTWQLAT